MKCPKCGHTIPAGEVRSEAARLGRAVQSEAQARASRENGKKGGRPRKSPQVPYSVEG